METIEVRKVDDVNLFITCDQGTSMELYHYFSRFTKNYLHDIRFKNRVWNGKIQFFSSKDRTLPIGLLTDLIAFSKQYKYKLDFKFDVTTLYDKDFTPEMFTKYIKENLSLPFEPRDYQIESVQKALKRKRGICLMPTSCLDKDSKIMARINSQDLQFLKDNFEHYGTTKT